ncbi:MAG: alpha-N-acetylglucosaminidase C-terminal domain-containing protein [Candidatus Omnitrophica bacterium]|nr:alpha-N-acetylglucosaminidase C-terminal domain-containing protein [Candidatus Omnitrophota bacterium]
MFKKILFMIFILFPILSFSFTIVENKKPKAMLFLSNNNSFIEKFATFEFASLIEKSTETKIPIKNNYENFRNIIIIGTKQTLNIKEFLTSKDLNFLNTFSDYDAFLIKTVKKNGKNFLIFVGSNERSCLYSIYHFFENELNYGFFWEGDVIPKFNSIKIKNLNIYEKAFFSIRFYMQECNYGYTTRPWDINDWKKELLWMCKKKLNMIFIAEDHWNFIVKRDEIVEEAKKLGLICVFHIPLYRWAAVDKKFIEENPNHKYVEAKYRDTFYYIYPTDELFIEKGKEKIKTVIEKYGKGNYYFISPYGEASFPTLKDEELTQLRKDFAQTVINIILSEDPEGKWIFWTWPFGFLNWNKKDVEIFLKQIPKEKVFICDSPEKIGEWHYKRYNNFFDYNFALSFILLYGGDDHMKGNLFKTLQEIKKISEIKNLKGIYICPEILHYNTIYFDLLCYLAWNPVNLDMENYLNNFILKRYGKNSYIKMKRALEYLTKAVYDNIEGAEPLYQRRIYPPGEGMMGMYITKIAQDIQDSITVKLPYLKKAIETFTDEYDCQRNNDCFLKDYTDLLRQYASELFNLNIYLLNKDFIMRNRDGFKKDKENLLILLNIVEEILSLYQPYKISYWFDRVKNLPNYNEYEKIIKTTMFTFAHLDEGSIDYPTKDIYEVFKFYCKPRILTYLNWLEINFENDINLTELKELYKKIEKNWLTTPLENFIFYDSPKIEKHISLKEIGKKLLNQNFIVEERFRYIENQSLKSFGEKNLEIIWEEDFKNVDNWKITYYKDGYMVSDGEIATIYPPQNRKAIVFGRDIPGNVNIENYPILSLKFKQNFINSDTPFEALSKFVIWITWKDINGRSYRNRVFQKELITFNKWTIVNLDLYSILSTISVPKEINKIEIEAISNSVSFDWIKIGKN